MNYLVVFLDPERRQNPVAVGIVDAALAVDRLGVVGYIAEAQQIFVVVDAVVPAVEVGPA